MREHLPGQGQFALPVEPRRRAHWCVRAQLDQRANNRLSKGCLTATAHAPFDLRVVARRVEQAPPRSIDAHQAQLLEKAPTVSVRLRQRAQRMSHHLGKRLLPEFLAALAERGIAEAHVEELPDERGKTAMKMNLLGDEPDDDLPGANLLPRPLMPPLLRWHDALELWTKGFEGALRMLARGALFSGCGVFGIHLSFTSWRCI